MIELLGSSRAPSTATEDYLRAHRAGGGDAAVTADLALGRVAAAVGTGDPARAGAIVDELAAELDDAPPERLPGLIAALGNTASPAILDVVAPYLDHASIAVRRQAVRAVGRIPGVAADRLLAGSIAGEPEDDQLAFAIGIVARRPVASIVHDALTVRGNEPHADHVRAAITAELARH